MITLNALGHIHLSIVIVYSTAILAAIAIVLAVKAIREKRKEKKLTKELNDNIKKMTL